MEWSKNKMQPIFNSVVSQMFGLGCGSSDDDSDYSSDCSNSDDGGSISGGGAGGGYGCDDDYDSSSDPEVNDLANQFGRLRFADLSKKSKVKELRDFIDQEGLKVSKGTGGPNRRTIPDIYNDIKRALSYR